MSLINQDNKARHIIGNFEIDGSFAHAETIDAGHINDTFLVKTRKPECPDYILQRINHNIFKDVDNLMNNIQRVSRHIQTKLQQDKETQNQKYLKLVKSKHQKFYHQDADGNYWRCYVYVPNQSAGLTDITPKMAFEGGKALGKFQALLADLPGNPLHETIPEFHNLENRLRAFDDAVGHDPANRVKSVEKEISAFKSRANEMLIVHQLGKQGEFPLRVTHNDTKFNNILFDENEEAICIIDLDTVMNGYVLYDFGDAIRTLCNTANEDEADLEKVNFNFELFQWFSKGFLTETHQVLRKKEIDYLAFSAKLMTYIIGLRFLTDYLLGDVYYKTECENHNLIRVRNQLKLLSEMEKSYDGMLGVIAGIVGVGDNTNRP